MMINIFHGHFVSIWFLIHWAIKIFFIFYGSYKLLHAITILYLKFIKIGSMAWNQRDWSLSFERSWFWVNALALTMIILGIII